MLITDYSNQKFKTVIPGTDPESIPSLAELLTAGMIFILPIIFLLVISAN